MGQHWRSPRARATTVDGYSTTLLLGIMVCMGLVVGSVGCVYYIAMMMIGGR